MAEKSKELESENVDDFSDCVSGLTRACFRPLTSINSAQSLHEPSLRVFIPAFVSERISGMLLSFLCFQYSLIDPQCSSFFGDDDGITALIANIPGQQQLSFLRSLLTAAQT